MLSLIFPVIFSPRERRLFLATRVPAELRTSESLRASPAQKEAFGRRILSLWQIRPFIAVGCGIVVFFLLRLPLGPFFAFALGILALPLALVPFYCADQVWGRRRAENLRYSYYVSLGYVNLGLPGEHTFTAIWALDRWRRFEEINPRKGYFKVNGEDDAKLVDEAPAWPTTGILTGALPGEEENSSTKALVSKIKWLLIRGLARRTLRYIIEMFFSAPLLLLGAVAGATVLLNVLEYLFKESIVFPIASAAVYIVIGAGFLGFLCYALRSAYLAQYYLEQPGSNDSKPLVRIVNSAYAHYPSSEADLRRLGAIGRVAHWAYYRP